MIPDWARGLTVVGTEQSHQTAAEEPVTIRRSAESYSDSELAAMSSAEREFIE